MDSVNLKTWYMWVHCQSFTVKYCSRRISPHINNTTNARPYYAWRCESSASSIHLREEEKFWEVMYWYAACKLHFRCSPFNKGGSLVLLDMLDRYESKLRPEMFDGEKKKGTNWEGKTKPVSEKTIKLWMWTELKWHIYSFLLSLFWGVMFFSFFFLYTISICL